MTAASPGKGQRIGTMVLVQGGLARLQAEAPVAAAVGLALAVVGLAVELAARDMGVDLEAPDGSSAYVGYILASSAPTSLASALLLRLFIEGRARLFRIDRGILECAAIIFVMTVTTMAGAVYLGMLSAAAAGSPARVFVASVLYLGLMYALLKLTLWPIGHLMGRVDITPLASWRLMSKATRGLVLAAILAAIPAILIGGIAGGAALMEEGPPTMIAMAVLQAASAAYAVSVYAIEAVLYRLRVEAPSTFAKVFD